MARRNYQAPTQQLDEHWILVDPLYACFLTGVCARHTGRLSRPVAIQTAFFPGGDSERPKILTRGVRVADNSTAMWGLNKSRNRTHRSVKTC